VADALAEQRCDEYGDVHHVRRDLEVGRHRWRDVEGGLCKQPEGEHTENDAKRSLSSPRYEAGVRVMANLWPRLSGRSSNARNSKQRAGRLIARDRLSRASAWRVPLLART
jgi:hypothetical protein